MRRAELGDVHGAAHRVAAASTSTARRSARAAASSVMHTFPADGDYVFRMVLHSIHGRGRVRIGSTARGEQMEISIDGERVALIDIDR